MSAITRTETFDQLYSLTVKARRKRIGDNVGNSQPTLDVFAAADRVEIEDGGSEIHEDVMYAYQTAEWMSDRQKVSTDDTEGVTKAIFPWRFALAPINISFTDELKAQGMDEKQQMDFMESKAVQARQGLRTAVNTAMNSAASGKAMLGNQDIVADVVATGTLGGINRATDTWWRNQVYTSTVDMQTQTTAGLWNGLSTMSTYYELASDINDEVTHIFTGGTLYGEILACLEGTGYARYEGGTKANIGVASQGLDAGPKFRNARIVKDRAVASQHIYGYNLNTMKLKIMKGANFVKTPFVRADASGVLAKISFVVVGIQLVTNNPRRNFVLTTIT